jgi:hypothetical protein
MSSRGGTGSRVSTRRKQPSACSAAVTIPSLGRPSATSIVALSLAVAASVGSAQAACTSSVVNGVTRVVCSGATTDHYWAPENTISAV